MPSQPRLYPITLARVYLVLVDFTSPSCSEFATMETDK